MKKELTIENLIAEAGQFCENESRYPNPNLYGVTDGKAVGTHIEHKFQDILNRKYRYTAGSAARGIDFPDQHLNTDIKVTSITQPQSSCPFRDARQKIYGLGYNLLLFVYEKADESETQTAILNFKSCAFIHKERTGDYQTTKAILQMIENSANTDDIIAYLMDRNIPADDITLRDISEEIIANPPRQGYLTISSAFQWRLHYRHIVTSVDNPEGIITIVHNL